MRRPDSMTVGHDRPVRSSPTRRRTMLGGLAASALVLTGCSSEELPRLGLPEAATEQGHTVVNLWQGSWFAALVVGAIVWALIGWVVVFHRRRAGHEGSLPTQTRYNYPVEILYTVTPIIVVTVLFYFTWRDQNELLELDPDPDVTVHVVGQRWSWTFNYQDEDVYVPGTIDEPPTLVLPQGETVEFILSAADVVHSFWVPAFLFKLDMLPGDPNVVQMTPDTLGTFAGKCAELCGEYHSDMLFQVRVVTPDEYADFISGLEAAGQTGQIMPELATQEPGQVDPPRVEPGEEDE